MVALWRRLPIVVRQGALLLGAAILLALGVGLLGQRVAAQVRHCLDTELYHQAVALRFWFVNERYYLRDEAFLLAHYDELFTWLTQGDEARVKRFLALHQNAHESDHVYLLTRDDRAYFAASTPPLAPETVRSLDLVQKGFQGQAAAELTTADGRIWLVAVAPHADPEGQPDAVVVIVREMDMVFLESLVGGMSGAIWLTDGQHWVGPTDPAFVHALGLDRVRPPFEQGLQPYSARYQGRTYEVLVLPLGATHSGTYALALVRQATVLDRTHAQALTGGGLLALAIVATAVGVLYFHARAIFAPLERLRQAAARIAQGNLEMAIQPTGAPEVRDLAAHIETMRQRLRDLLAQEQALRQRLAARLEEQSGTLAQMCREREQLLTRLITAQEEERRRVSRELHDETSQELANLIVRLGALARTVDDEEVLRQLQKLRQHAARTLEGVNRIVMDLRPGLLDEYGLVPAVQWYADSRLSPQGVAVKVKARGTPRPLSPHVQVSVYRVLQEAINNIAQHAQAQRATIAFDWRADALQVVVEDDGRGFEAAEVAQTPSQHFGLLGMRERIHLVGGSFRIESAPGQGTRIEIQVPYDSHAGMEDHEPQGPTPEADSRPAGG